jgi:hypothetical protein
MIGTRKIEFFDWNDSNTEKLTNHWKDGLPTSEIARLMPGTTRNSIIGKASRLGLESRKKGGRKPPAPKQQSSQPKAKVLSLPKPLIPFMKINHRTCRSIEGYEMVQGHRMALYCPNPKQPDESYCPHHHSIYNVGTGR